MTAITYTIPNISCNHCIHTIVTELSDLEGVNSVQGSLADKKVTVTYEPPTTQQEIEHTLAEINYPVAQ